ncbi:unnamed protein product [Didymodactylos carnosus]|uniref:Glycoside hydrolase family 65 central catalytic domain-containing protein n=1 Tax=Didymodactylos carnosus TaxID=1234261 RepID=A0A814Y545_9BILA|nr:unnamed protein product [Didymodactylos carnosus]CAF1225428.1 unnamed protein product [Didymodactylos carnosus]CAF3800790.1 unnamed protein product [Didymodactylos carnosus]CAF3988383.1 unnamed protein product [Didymodactylos carnosus]
MPGTDANGNDIEYFECGPDYSVECDINVLAARCNVNSNCRGFNTNGFLKSCTAGCDQGCCYDVTQNVDLYIKKGYLPPKDWIDDINGARILFANPEPHFCFLPEIGNGYIATVAMSASIFQSGLFTGKCGNIGKARLPSPIGGTVTNAPLIASGLHFNKGTFARRYQIDADNVIEQRVYISRPHRSVMVLEFELNPSSSVVSHSPSSNVTFDYSWTFDPLNQTHNPETACVGGGNVEIDVLFTFNTTLSTSTLHVYEGIVDGQDDRGRTVYVTICTNPVPSSITLSSSTILQQYIATLASSIDFGPDPISQTSVTLEAINRFEEANAFRPKLFTSNMAAWKNLWKSGIDLFPHQSFQPHIQELDTNFDGTKDTQITTFSRSLDIAQHINSSMYFLLTSSREDWPYGISPGGLSSQSYSGVMFFDMDWYMMPGLLPFYPEFAENILRYRYNSLAESNKIARVFNYSGAMYAWTASYFGRPQGCCDGHGGWELCIEQHVTADVSIAVRMYYYATQNKEWLENIGWPILRDVAIFYTSRVTKNADDTYSINGVMPVDEWCDNEQSKCGDIGVNNAVMTNAGAVISLQFATEVGNMFNFDVDPSWIEIANGIRIGFNSTTQTHIQWDGALPPDPHHYVCPEDVLYLTYPMNFNITPEIVRNDAEKFVPITCKENAGMTAPIHNIVWLMLNESFKAEGEFNRSLQACTYGEFHVRNEVDIHSDIIGGHGFNSHFLTGDGGFLQAVINGYAGLRFEANRLVFNPLPGVLTAETNSIRLRNILLQGTYPFHYTVDSYGIKFRIDDIFMEKLCVTDSNQNKWTIPTGDELKLEFDKISLPVIVQLC